MNYKQTVEFRAADGSANVYLLMAGLTLAALHGLEMDNSLDYASKTYVDINIFEDNSMDKLLETLPDSCMQSANALEHQKQEFLKYDIFTEDLLDNIIKQLRAFKDENLRSEVAEDEQKLVDLVQHNLHCG